MCGLICSKCGGESLCGVSMNVRGVLGRVKEEYFCSNCYSIVVSGKPLPLGFYEQIK